MYELLKAGGFTNGGLNFDAKARRASNTNEDIFYSYIAGMDTFALGLKMAQKVIDDGKIDKFVEERYASWQKDMGQKIIKGELSIAELEKYALEMGDVKVGSGRQEYLEGILNSLLFA
jgi:xylose isomerase